MGLEIACWIRSFFLLSLFVYKVHWCQHRKDICPGDVLIQGKKNPCVLEGQKGLSGIAISCITRPANRDWAFLLFLMTAWGFCVKAESARPTLYQKLNVILFKELLVGRTGTHWCAGRGACFPLSSWVQWLCWIYSTQLDCWAVLWDSHVCC